MFHPYLDYYMVYVKPDEQERNRLLNIYWETESKCHNFTDFQLYAFVTAWLSDKDEPNGIGPNFTMALAYMENTADVAVTDADFFKEAAIRDYILTCERPPVKIHQYILSKIVEFLIISQLSQGHL